MDFGLPVALALGLLTSLIAYLQWRTAADKVRLDLFDRRWECYKAFEQFITAVCVDLDLKDLDVLRAFDRGTVQSRFLFGEDVERYRKDLRNRAITLREWNTIYRQGTQDPDGDARFREATAGMDAEGRWFADQLGGRRLLTVFAPYLDLSKT